MKGIFRHFANMFSTLGVGMFIGTFFDPKGMNYLCVIASVSELLLSVAFIILAESGGEE